MKHQHGVTLIELMIVVAIVSILAAIAYPSYRNQLLRSHRAEAKSALLQVQVAQEKYFLQYNSYAITTAQLTNAPTASPPGLGIATTTTNGYYTIAFDTPTPTATTYKIKATATGSQASDTACATFTIDQSGARTPTSGCW